MTVTGNLLGEASQMRFGFDFGVGREAISKYENGRSKVPADIIRNIVGKFDDPN